MFNKKDKKTEGAFLDQTKRNIANSMYKSISSVPSRIFKKTKNLVEEVNEIIKNNKNNKEFNDFLVSFDKEKFFEDLKALINKKFLQRKTNTFLKISLNDINENLSFFSFTYNVSNNSITCYLNKYIDLFYEYYCSPWEISINGDQFYIFDSKN